MFVIFIFLIYSFFVFSFSYNSLNAKIVGVYDFKSDPNFIDGKVKSKPLKSYKIFGIKYIPKVYKNYSEIGVASWYGKNDNLKDTANGETFYGHLLTAAHRTLPINSIVKVTNLENNHSAVVRINDRGPYADTNSRIIDLSEGAAKKLGFYKKGMAVVAVELLTEETKKMEKILDSFKKNNDGMCLKDNVIFKKSNIQESESENTETNPNPDIQYVLID